MVFILQVADVVCCTHPAVLFLNNLRPVSTKRVVAKKRLQREYRNKGLNN